MRPTCLGTTGRRPSEAHPCRRFQCQRKSHNGRSVHSEPVVVWAADPATTSCRREERAVAELRARVPREDFLDHRVDGRSDRLRPAEHALGRPLAVVGVALRLVRIARDEESFATVAALLDACLELRPRTACRTLRCSRRPHPLRPRSTRHLRPSSSLPCHALLERPRDAEDRATFLARYHERR
jgi:hypothetical protein